jgi:hypothetical protein
MSRGGAGRLAGGGAPQTPTRAHALAMYPRATRPCSLADRPATTDACGSLGKNLTFATTRAGEPGLKRMAFGEASPGYALHSGPESVPIEVREKSLG